MSAILKNLIRFIQMMIHSSTPIKMPSEPGKQYTISPLPPSFVWANESSIADSVGENDSSQFADSNADTISTPTSKTRDSTSVSKAQSVLASNLSAEILQ